MLASLRPGYRHPRHDPWPPPAVTAQYRFGDDVALDFVRSAVDRDFSVVEVHRRRLGGVVRADDRFVVALEVALVRHDVGTDDLHQQFGQLLLDDRSFQLQDRRGRVLPALCQLAFIRNDPKLGHFQRFQFDLDRGEFFLEARGFDQRALTGEFQRGEFLDAGDLGLRGTDAGDAGAFVAEQEFGVVPAFVLLADEVLDGDFDVVEEDLVHLAAAVDGDDRADGDAGGLHVDQDERNALLRLGARDRCGTGRRSSRRIAPAWSRSSGR